MLVVISTVYMLLDYMKRQVKKVKSAKNYEPEAIMYCVVYGILKINKVYELDYRHLSEVCS